VDTLSYNIYLHEGVKNDETKKMEQIRSKSDEAKKMKQRKRKIITSESVYLL